MESDKKLIDYEAEAKKLDEAQSRPDFWNPTAGKFDVFILSELEQYEFTDKDGAVQRRAKINVECSGKVYVWSFGIGSTKASTYGQLVDYARKHANKLTGAKITVVIKSDGKKRDFTIV